MLQVIAYLESKIEGFKVYKTEYDTWNSPMVYFIGTDFLRYKSRLVQKHFTCVHVAFAI